MPLAKPTACTALALTLGAAAPAAIMPAAAQFTWQEASAQAIVSRPARQGPGLGHRQMLIPTSGIETPADIGRRAHTSYRILVQPKAAGAPWMRPSPETGPPYAGYLVETPASIACVYGLVAATPGCKPDEVTTVATGGSKMIAIVDAYDMPTASADLQAFSNQFGLPAANLKVVYAAGTQPTSDTGWALEEALDIEMAHAMAPNATIALVEAASSSWNDLGVAIDAAYNLVQQAGGGEVSMSFGGSEFAGETALESHFAKQGFVVFYAATGDSSGTSYPSTSPNVVAVGGSAIARVSLNPQYFGTFKQETTWEDSGGGLSSVFQRPTYQQALATRFSFANARSVPDVAAVASSLTPVWVYCSSCQASAGWYTVAGTSVATPLTAGMANKWGNFRQSSQTELTYLYTNAAGTSAFFNVAVGTCGPDASYFATGGSSSNNTYDLCTGLGTPRTAQAF